LKLLDKILLLFSDTHGGHQLGLMRSGVELYAESFEGEIEPWYPAQNAVQIQLEKWWYQDLAFAHQIAAGRPIIAVHNGDPTQVQKYPREWVSTRAADQIMIAANNMEAVLELPTIERLDFILGTGSHEFGEGSASILLAEFLRKDTEKPVTVKNHSLLEINGATFDIAHHGPIPGSRRWLEGNGLRWYTNDIQQRSLDLGQKPPDWVVRSHYHTFARSASDYRQRTTHYRTESVITPGYTGMDAFARQATRSKWEVHVGVLVFEVFADGTTKLHPKFRVLDIRNKEIIE
jgi:hypothetical protein